MPIYIDEAGFTGNDLLNPDQPFFSLASVQITEEEAQYLIEKTRQDFRLQGNELKAKNLLVSTRGKAALQYLIHNLSGRYALTCDHKEYALCCKFFEYIFEPVLQENNSLFYEKKFHLFIANMLFMFVTAERKSLGNLIDNFAQMMREGNFDLLYKEVATSADIEKLDESLKQVIDFIKGYAPEIIEELDAVNVTGSTGKWVLDLSISSLCSLLRHWNQTTRELVVYCDNSKPLAASKTFLDVMVGREDRPILTFPGGKKYCPVFNLKQPLSFKDSKDSYGLQLADILAGMTVYALKSSDDELLQFVDDGKIDESIFPTLENVNLGEKAVFINGVVLMELANRAKRGCDPVYGMREYYEIAESRYDSNPPT